MIFIGTGILNKKGFLRNAFFEKIFLALDVLSCDPSGFTERIETDDYLALLNRFSKFLRLVSKHNCRVLQSARERDSAVDDNYRPRPPIPPLFPPPPPPEGKLGALERS